MKSIKTVAINFSAIVIASVMRNKLNAIVRIEGGLGSQIIGLLTYEAKKALNPKVRADVSYYLEKEVSINEREISMWDWELDRYGFRIENYMKDRKFYDKYLAVINSKLQPKGNSKAKESPYIPWRLQVKRFPVAEDLSNYLQKYELSMQDDFAVIHIRRGDYLRVSSRVLSLESSVLIFERFLSKPSIPIFVASDDMFSDEELKYLEMHFGAAPLIIVEPNTDLHLIHGLMRSASVLVTSNSTFSWTAGMLNTRKAQLTISPTTFFGDADPQVNELFRSTSSWMVLDVD